MGPSRRVVSRLDNLFDRMADKKPIHREDVESIGLDVEGIKKVEKLLKKNGYRQGKGPYLEIR